MSILVTGGTGSFGHHVVRELVAEGARVRVYSRDEEKQRRMAQAYPGVEFVIGDVRDRSRLRRAMHGIERVFHAAALKQVPQSEDHPYEAYLTNVVGTENVCSVAADAGARVVLLSTDKAVEPVGVMGATKLLAERVCVDYGFNVVRYGNVIGSRGSIVPIFRTLIAQGRPITVTDPGMTRFLITLGEAVGMIRLAMNAEPAGIIFVRKSPAATVRQIVRAMLPAPDYPVIVTGVRPGEKAHELLIAAHESAQDVGDHFEITPVWTGGGMVYSSYDAPELSDDELRALIAEAPTDDYR